MERKDLEALDTDAAAASPSTARVVLAALKALLLELLATVSQLREAIEAQNERLLVQTRELEQFRKALLGPKSERRPPAKRATPELSPEDSAAKHDAKVLKRREGRKQRREVAREVVHHPVPDACPSCSGSNFTALDPEVTRVFEYVPAHVVCHEHVIHRAVCACGKHMEGSRPFRVGESSQLGPRLHAAIVVAKCGDAMPIHRLVRAWARGGFKLSRSTANDAFHRVAVLLEPLYTRLLALVAKAQYVNADETSQPVMDRKACRRGFIWTFITDTIIAYVFSPTRSGDTAAVVLGDSKGMLQVDGYTGYNTVTTPTGRVRAGCIAHARRYFHEAHKSAPAEVNIVLDFIHELYQVEYDAAAEGALGTEKHAALRLARSKPIFDQWKAWLDAEKPKCVPKSPLGAAVRYTLNQWQYLTRCLTDPKLPLDNNVAERHLRIVGLGRDTFRWVGNDEAGAHLATLHTLVATCVAIGINPELYIADVLERIDVTPYSRIDELLPANWKAAAHA